MADIIHSAGRRFIDNNRHWLNRLHLKVLTVIERCRTAALGGHIDKCAACGHKAISYNSCRNRHCPRCQANARDRWIEARSRDLLPVPYAHVVFTLPHELAPPALQTPRASSAPVIIPRRAERNYLVTPVPKGVGRIGSNAVSNRRSRNGRIRATKAVLCRRCPSKRGYCPRDRNVRVHLAHLHFARIRLCDLPPFGARDRERLRSRSIIARRLAGLAIRHNECSGRHSMRRDYRTHRMTDASTIDLLEQQLKADWTHLRAARELANHTLTELRQALTSFDSADTVIVVSGSLAREEFTAGSDIDWTLLVDGSADPQHYDLTAKINKVVERIAGKPTGAEGTFSAMVFSHDLIHDIGGEDDTNQNTTRRLLLLLESAPVGREDAYTRVLRSILKRYLRDDRGFWKGRQFRVPRFLQNDFARYWRTMAVDFAYKLRKRSGRGWAIRNIKLRMSRKLIYVSGLLACYQCHLDHTADEWSTIALSPHREEQIINYYSGVFRQTPLEIVSGVLLRYPHLDEAANQILGSYNEFLGILADNKQRDGLESLAEADAETNDVYQEARQLSHTFRDGLLKLFFDSNSEMDELTKNYGVF